MDDEPIFEAGIRIGQMWRQLGDVIESGLSQHVDAGNPIEAIRWATCAEACFWKATGEAATHDVKDVLPKQDGDHQ